MQLASALAPASRAPKTLTVSAWAAIALALLDWIPPPAVSVAVPVIEVPGETPKAPYVVVVPVLVTAAPPRTEYPTEPERVGEVAA